MAVIKTNQHHQVEDLFRLSRQKIYIKEDLINLYFWLKKTGGRNNYGRMTTRHIGGGHKRLYREIDFKRNKDNISAVVERIEYDPNRSSHIALVFIKMVKGDILLLQKDSKKEINFIRK